MAELKWSPLAQGLVFLALLLFLTGYLFSTFLSIFSGIMVLSFLFYAKQSFQETIGSIHIQHSTIDPVLFVNHPINMKTRITCSEGPIYLSIQAFLPKYATLMTEDLVIRCILSLDHPAEFIYQVKFHSRGRQQFPNVNCRVSDRFQLFSVILEIDSHYECSIHSNPEDIQLAKRVKMKEDPQLFLTTFLGQELNREFEGIRSYSLGDNSRDIDWKASSRLQNLVTKVFQKQCLTEVIIALDVSREMRRTMGEKSKIEHGIAILVQLTYVLQSLHHKVGFMAFDEYTIRSVIKPSFFYQPIFKACSELPSVIPLDQYVPTVLKNPSMEGNEEDVDHQQFLSIVSPFLLEGGPSVKHGVQVTGIYQAIKKILTHNPKTHIIVLSDLEANVQAFHAAVSLVHLHHSTLWILCMNAPQYYDSLLKMDKETVEKLYQYREARKTFLNKLRRSQVEIIEVSPKLQVPQIIRTIHGR